MDTVATQNNWLSLFEYSTEHGVSVSTLRRRIKNNQIKYKMINGKYYLNCHSIETGLASASSVPKTEVNPVDNAGARISNKATVANENSFQTAKILLDELKKAYMQSLQDKEKQIIQLKQQIADLKTLVMYLERENEKNSSGTRF